MWEIGGLLSAIVFVALAIVVLVAIIIYSLKLQRGAVSTQKAVVDDHFAEKALRQRHLDLAEEALQLQKRAIADDMETRQLLKRHVELSEEILKELRNSRS